MSTLANLLRRREDPVEVLAAINAAILHRFYKNPSVSVTTRADPLCAEIHYNGELVCWATVVMNRVIVASGDNKTIVGMMGAPAAILFINDILQDLIDDDDYPDAA